MSAIKECFTNISKNLQRPLFWWRHDYRKGAEESLYSALSLSTQHKIPLHLTLFAQEIDRTLAEQIISHPFAYVIQTCQADDGIAWIRKEQIRLRRLFSEKYLPFLFIENSLSLPLNGSLKHAFPYNHEQWLWKCHIDLGADQWNEKSFSALVGFSTQSKKGSAQWHRLNEVHDFCMHLGISWALMGKICACQLYKKKVSPSSFMDIANL